MKIVTMPRMVKDVRTPLSNHFRSIILCCKPLILFLLLGSLLKPDYGVGQAANLDQIRNGTGAAPTSPASWVNGNAGPSNAHYREGWSVAYRMYCTGLTAGAHTLIIEYDTKDQNGHAIDYITHYDNLDNPSGSHVATFGHAKEVINPTIGIAGLGAPSTFAIPAPSSAGSEVLNKPTNSFNALAAGLRLMTIWNGTITAISYPLQEAPDATTGSTQTQVKIEFTTTGSTALLAWGGHIAAEYDWGVGRGASKVSGSPYHTRLITIDGKGGNQDRSLKADAVVVPNPDCVISAAQSACPETAFLTFNSTGSNADAGTTYLWTLTNGATSAGAKIDPVTGATSATVKVVPIGTAFIAGGTFSLTLRVTRSTGQFTECTRSPAGTIVKVVVQASANPTSIDIGANNTSQLDAVMTGSDDANAANYNFSWAQDPGPGGSLSDANIKNPVFTATAAGTYTFTVTATQKAAPGCVDTSKVVVNVGASTPACKVTGPSPICPSSTNTYKYDPDENGVANALPANFTAKWTLENNTNGASINAPDNTNSVSVTAGAGCGTSYRIVITLTSTTGLITTSCYKDVTVNDTQAPTITSCPADAVIECDASTDPANTGTATASDNCSASVSYKDETTPGCYNKIVRTWTATDPCGNTATCTQTIILRDRTAPQIDCSGGGTPTVSDNCTPTGSIELYSRDDGSVRTWTAVDAAGNVATCTQNLPAPPVTQASAPARQAEQSTSTVLVTNNVKTNLVTKKDLEVQAFPNPFGTVVNFRFVSPKAGKAVLDVYDIMGRKIGTAYQGNLEANELKTIVYKVPSTVNSPLVYRLAVSDLSTRGKLMPLRK